MPSDLKRELTIEPQRGPQTLAMESDADVLIYGGAAGGGKSEMLLMEPLKWINESEGGCVILRRTIRQIKNEGGLWDRSMSLYGSLGAKPNSTDFSWQFPKGFAVTMSGCEHEIDRYNFDGAQIALLELDELQHFTKTQFIYLLSRNRSMAKFRSYCRASCNPAPPGTPGHWIYELIYWWIDPQGDPIKERSGVVRYFVTHQEKFVTASSKAEIRKQLPHYKNEDIKSFTFVHADLEDNKIMLDGDPGYRANIMAQPEHERKRLMGNWLAVREGKMFKQTWFKHITPDKLPSLISCVVGVDPSGGHGPKNDAQGIIPVGKDREGNYYVLADRTCKLSPAGWGSEAVQTYKEFLCGKIAVENNYGGEMVESTIHNVDPTVKVESVRATRGKAIRAEPIAQLYENGKVFHVGFLSEAEAEMVNFDPNEPGPSPNRMDAIVWAITSQMEGGDPPALRYLKYLNEQDKLKNPTGKKD